jgi:hypothetical protein
MIRRSFASSLLTRSDGDASNFNVLCRVWLDQEEDVKEGEGFSIERATESDYIHNQDE